MRVHRELVVALPERDDERAGVIRIIFMQSDLIDRPTSGATPVELCSQLRQTRERTRRLTQDLSTEQLMGPMLPIVNPVLWEIGHVGWFHEYWTLRHAHGLAPLIERIAGDNQIRHVRVAREAEAIAICSGAFFGGVRAVALMGATGLLTCTGELATLNLRHQIPVFLIVSQRGSIDDHRIYQEVQGRRTIPLLQSYDFPYHVIDRSEDIATIPDAFEACRMQKRPFVLFLTRRLVKGKGAKA